MSESSQLPQNMLSQALYRDDDPPPKYTDPSATDDISSLISTALEVQNGLFNAREGLKRVNTERVNELLQRLVDTDEKFLKLLENSRTSAADLCNAIQNFMNVAIPISLDTEHPMEKRVAVVKRFADKIATSAQKDLRPYDEQVLALKQNLDQLVKDLTAIQANLQNQSGNANTTDEQLTRTDSLNSNHTPATLLHQRIFRLLSVIRWFGVPRANSKTTVTAVQPSRVTTVGSVVVEDAVLRDISALVAQFSGLVGKLGHFSAVWEKLVTDSTELSTYLSQGTGNRDVIGNRVQAELGVYEKIKLALDDYCLRTR